MQASTNPPCLVCKADEQMDTTLYCVRCNSHVTLKDRIRDMKKKASRYRIR